jgi:hypothetical protein
MRAGTQQDALAIAQNGGLSGQDTDDGDLEGDAEVDMDDDMMDKISSSPSIEDGGSTFGLPTLYSRKQGSPTRSATLRNPSPAADVCDPRSSSPYLESPDHLPLRGGDHEERQCAASTQSSFVPSSASTPRHHHLDGESGASAPAEDDTSNETCSFPNDFDFDESLPWADEEVDDNVMPGDGLRRTSTGAATENHAEEGEGADAECDLTIPYESDEDDDGDFSGLSDSRFIDSGWGGECLQDTEDIDFDFVYALHTFVATVEGQANATKGDTMVLLDDSNSYWWLVRVVKDSSIGKPSCIPPGTQMLICGFLSGYLPAEHIETPTERLARLNKHRNIDVR